MYSESSSEDELIELAAHMIGRPRTFRDRTNPFDFYDDIDFKSRFRFNKNSVNFLYNHLRGNLEPVTARNKPVNAMEQILCALRFYATGSFQTAIGDMNFNISSSTVCRIVKKISIVIAQLKPDFVKMPSDEEVNEKKKKFYQIARFPGVIGAIDCTHIKINSPGGDQAELFRNRKGYFSINVQAVCDSDLQFLNIIARWPGSVHDSRIFNDSPLKHDLENGMFANSYLLGDNGYPCRNYLLTPLLNPQTRAEQKYNAAHIRTRNTIERAFGVLKKRFPCLSLGLRLKLERTLHVIVACFVLHNLAILLKDDTVDNEDLLDNEQFELDLAVLQENNNHVRRSLINSVFSE